MSLNSGSTSSSNTTSTQQQQHHHLQPSNEQEGMDPSNILYNDHQNYQTIFSNDSRFFDTSLHLYKSYRKLGYIQVDNKKSKKSKVPTSMHISKAQSNGHSNHTRSKSTGFRTNHQSNGHNDGALKVEVPRKNDPLIRQRSNMDSSNVKAIKPQPSVKTYDDGSDENSSNESDIIVTRL